MLPALFPALLLASTAAMRLEGDLGLGGGYDTNLDLAPSGSAISSFGSPTVSGWVDVGTSWALSDTTRLYAGGRYDGVWCPDASDLSRHAPGLELSLTQELGPRVAVIVSPALSYAFYGDPARSAWRLGARATLRVRPVPWLSLRAGYARAQSWASDPVFSLGVDRILGSVEVRLGRGSYLAAGYALSLGDQVFYQSITTVVVTGRGGHRGTGTFSTLVPYQASATEHTLSLRWEQGLWSDLYLTLGYEHTRGSSSEGPYGVNSWYGAVGWRF